MDFAYECVKAAVPAQARPVAILPPQPKTREHGRRPSEVAMARPTLPQPDLGYDAPVGELQANGSSTDVVNLETQPLDRQFEFGFGSGAGIRILNVAVN